MTVRFPYRILTEWSAEDGVFVSRVPALSYCSAHGDTPEGAVREVLSAASAALASLRDAGRARPAPDVASPPAAV